MKRTGMFMYVVILIGASLLAACGQAVVAPNANPSAPAVAPLATANPNSTNANSIPLTPDNCTLLSKEEVGTVLAEAVDQVREEAKGTLCVYQTKNLIFELTFLNTGGMSGVQFMQNVQSINVNSALVPGLGDEAFYNGSSTYNILFIRKGDSVNTFGLRSSDPSSQGLAPEEIQAKEKALAVLLLSHLP